MAMKTKKERFHVGALNQDLKGGNEQREKVEEEEGGGLLQNTLFNFTSHTVGDKIQGGVVGGVHVGKILRSSLTVLESNSCLFCARTFSTPAWSVYVTNPNPLRRIEGGKGKKRG